MTNRDVGAEEEYTEELERLLEGIRRLPDALVGAKALNAECVGNLMQNHNQPGVDEWYKKALEGYRATSAVPTTKQALVLWKLGETQALEETCRALVAIHGPRLKREGLTAGETAGSFQEKTCGHFLLGEYSDVVDSAEAALARGIESGKPYVQTAALEMARGLLAGEGQPFDRGLAILAERVGDWPSSASSLHHDLYRFSLSLLRPGSDAGPRDGSSAGSDCP